MKILIKILTIILITLLTILTFMFVINIVPKAPFSYKGENKFRTKSKYPMIIPHGGAKQLAPENTVYSYEMLINDYDAAVLEIDLALTKDGVLIAHHDLDLEFSATSPLDGKLIKDYTYAEIVAEYENDDYYLARNFEYIDGTKPFESLPKSELKDMIPARLKEDIFEQYGDTVLYILEIKDAPTSLLYEEGSMRYEEAAQALVDLVIQYDLEKSVVLASFSDEVITYFMEHAPNSMYNAGVSEVTNFSVYSAFFIDFFWKVKSQVLILPNRTSMSPITGSTARLLDKIPAFIRNNIGIKVGDAYEPNLMHKQIINDAHRKNMAVFYWTINDPDEMRELIKLGADGIITDRPDLLKQIIDELKLAE